ncbi:MAG TPA: c-type cytochrome, partial [Thermoanaerobaculia bacterium]|nr:c-type cytochrome [Thermoanaerobaculia bacterium]
YAPGKIDRRVAATPERVARGKKIASVSCFNCHEDATTGRLTGKRLVDAPKEFGPIFSKNITRDPAHGIGTWTDGELVYLLRTGVDRHGQYLPPYMPRVALMSDEDVESLVAFLRSDDPLVAAVAEDPPGVTQPSLLTKVLTHTVFRPLPFPEQRIETPAPYERVAYGRYLANSIGCFGCHSADFKTMNELVPEKTQGFYGGGNALLDQRGETIRTANLTSDDATGIGRWSEEDFDRALRFGVRPDKTVLLYPMVPLPELTREDTAALYAYLRTVPQLSHAVPRPVRAPVAADASEGKHVYYRYGCPACHGDNGVGIGDLRRAALHYPTDASLVAWIKKPSSFKPGTKMPTWDGVIAEADYPALIAYVRELGK